ncbi:flagellar biosynthetic protein FliR [Halomonas heilongjiangensis]|uniref:Flagellar biosynthetic protein FliR n=1 Tax=Halomonas heilongjiangensis TaxID=1387883 RepID=A0A2N7TQP6_9GAMM|nr:flagellar biosynthetic protein FliR [Halomonas heilongjiangensis]PMR70505.1 flagellar biosynthetic protein FliR [Halomonas heilongjiangensis]PXX92912.1 flagellar biosynthetic protein FliR [Halomonas heilongjiangensis]
MVEVTFAQLQGWLVAFLWPFARLTAFLAASPLWGHSSVPNQAKVGLAALVTVVIAPNLPTPPTTAVLSWAGLGIMLEQVLIGIAMGLVMRVTFAVVQATGEFIGLQMGLAFATFFDPGSGTNMVVLSRFLYMITLLMFLAFDGHLIVLEILATSFVTLPIGLGGFNPGAFELLARYGGTIFVSGMLLALPLVGSLLIINLALGILNRSAPQLTVFNIGFPTSLTVGLALMMVLMTDIGRFLQGMFAQAIDFLRQLLEALAPLSGVG